MFRPPPHRFLNCIGIDIHGTRETCDRPIEKDSPYPFCAEHRAALETMPRKRMCAGATTYDNALRPGRIECKNLTGHEDERLCAGCRLVEKQETERMRKLLREQCPHCGQPMPVRHRGLPGQAPTSSSSRAVDPRTHSTERKAFREEPPSGVRVNGASSAASPSWRPPPMYPFPNDDD